MAQVPKKNQLTDLSSLKAPEIKVPPVSEISVDSLLNDGLIALYREVKNLLIMSANGKLDPTDARDLRDHLRLLFELKDREAAALQELTDDQIKERAKELLDGNNQVGATQGSDKKN